MKNKDRNCMIALSCGAKRCKSCGTPNWDGGPVCGNCGEDPETEPEETLAFNPTLINQIGGCG